jgi:hypothetical protein
LGFLEVEATEFLDNRHIKVVMWIEYAALRPAGTAKYMSLVVHIKHCPTAIAFTAAVSTFALHQIMPMCEGTEEILSLNMFTV